MRPFAGFLVLLALLLLAVAAPGRVAARAGQLLVQVVNGTPGGGSVAGLPLTLYLGQNGQQSVAGTGRTGAGGSATLPALATAVEARYVVSTTYAGVAYHSDPLAAGVPTATLTVYEATDDDAALRIANAGIVVLGADPDTQVVHLLESVTLQNSGERTFLPSTTGARGPMGLLRFGLPAGAGNLAPQGELALGSIIQIDAGFATDLPVPPGQTQLSYLYDVAYGARSDGGYVQLSKNMPYSTDLLRALVIDGAFSVQSPQLVARGSATLNGKVYRTFEGSNLPPHGEVSLELRGLPLNLPFLRGDNPWVRAVVALLLLVAAALPLLYLRRYRRLSASMAPRPAQHARPARPAAARPRPVEREQDA